MAQFELKIEGYPAVRVDESFNSLSEQDKQKTIQEIMASMQPQTPPDSSLGTAFNYSEKMGQANTLNYAADANESLNQSFLGDFTRFGRENIGNPVREALGFDSIDTDAANAEFSAQQRARADALQQEAAAMNYRSMTTDDVDGILSAGKYALQKTAEAAPQMLTAIAAPMVTPLLTSAEVNASLSEIEGLDQGTRLKYATGAGMFMAVLENLGVSGVVAGIPKEVLGKMGVDGISDMLQKRGLTRVAKKFVEGAAAEGVTEFSQSAVKTGTEVLAGKEFADGEIAKQLFEETVAGVAVGGTLRGGGSATVETAKAANAGAQKLDGLAKVHGGDTEALTEVSKDVVQLDSQYDDRNASKSLEDADATLRDLHTQYMKSFDALKRKASEAGIDTNSAEFATAERRAKNRAKNEASNTDISFLTQIDPELGALARKMNVITRFNKVGVKGGVSQYTDLLNPAQGVMKSGVFGRATGATQALTSGAIAFYNPLLSASAVVGGRVVDAATGSRNRVAKAISKYSNRPGIQTDSQGQVQQAQAQQAEATALAGQQAAAAQQQDADVQAQTREQTLNNLKNNVQPPPGAGAEGTLQAATGLNRQQVAMTLRRLRRQRKDLVPTIDQYQAALEGKTNKVGNEPQQFYNLQNAVRQAAQEMGMETSNALAGTNQMLPSGGVAPNNIFNPAAYQATVDNAMRTADVAVQNAPTPELAQRANLIANAKSQAAKKALIEQTLQENPDQKDYVNNVLTPLADFGPKQQSRFPGADLIAEEREAAVEMYGEPVVVINHGTSKQSAATIDNEGFGTPTVFGAIDPRDADSFAQTVLQTNDNGRISIMMPESQFEQLRRNKMIQTREYKAPFGRTIIEYEMNRSALDRADVFRSRSLHKAGNKITDVERTQLVADALGNDFKVKFNASDDAYYRRQELITLTSDGDKRKTLHEIFHAVENRLSPEEMSIITNTDTYKGVRAEVDELYPDLNESAKMLEGLAETAARLQEVKGENTSRIKYILAKIKDLIESFKNLIDGNGFSSVNRILDDVYTGKTYQRGINEMYAQLYVPDIAYAKKDKPGGPMVAKRLKALYAIEDGAKAAQREQNNINTNYKQAMANIAENLGLPGIDGPVLERTLSRVTPSTDLGMIAADYLRAIGVMSPDGIVETSQDVDVEEVVGEHRETFLSLLKALQKAKIIDDFGLAFRTSAGGRMYPVHMLEPLLPELVAKAELNNVRKFENRAKPEHWEGKIEINGHPLGSYDNTQQFIDREQKQALVINDKIYEMMDKMQTTPQTHRGLDMIYKKDGTTDSAYTLASAEALKQYKDNQNDTGGMTPVFMKRRAQDRLRVDTLNGSASYQGKAGKAIWEFPNWEPLGENGFEQFAHSLRDHFGLPSELPYSERVGFLFGTVGQYLQTSGRPANDAVPQSDLDMPLIDYMVNAYGQPGSYVYSHTRGGTAKLFLDKQSGTTLYQKNHAIFDVAEHGFEMQRAAVELGRMRAFLENIIPDGKKMDSSELFMLPEAQEALMNFKSSYPVWFDGTSSSYQLHAVLTGDANLAKETNLGPFDPDAPGGDLYRPGAEYLQRLLNLPQSKTRKITKKFISNRRSYGQVKLTAMKSGADEIAKSVPSYGERTETGQWPQEVKDSLKQIQNDLETDFDSKFAGAAMAEGISRAIASTMFNKQGQQGFAVRVPLPDGDVAVYTGKLPDSAKKRVTWDINKDKRIAVPVYQDKLAITGFAAFLNHALDAYVQRELARRARSAGATGFMHTHDAFAVHPKNGVMMRELYWQIMRDLAGHPIYANILKANTLNADSVMVKYNITTPEGSQTVEMPMSTLLEKIQQQKNETFGGQAEPNYYALS